MPHQKKLVIGLFGFGVVGEGLYRTIHQTPSLQARIKKIAIKDPEKKRNAPSHLFTTDHKVLLNDPEINVIVEVINESEAAFEIVSGALKNGKEVVSASKKMLAEYLPELLRLQQQTGLSLLYEAAVCASIPIIRNLEEYYDNDLLHGVKGIVNGSTNFILTKMFEERLPFKEALLLAQQLGFAEADPSLDVEGHDAANKWVLLLQHAYGILTHPSRLVFSGIQHIYDHDARFAAEKNMAIKLAGYALKLKSGKVAAFVLPQFIGPDEPLSFVKNEYNGVVIESGISDKQFFYGKGAGSLPTASALLSDLSALRYDYHYEYKKSTFHVPHELADDFHLRAYLSFDGSAPIPKDHFEWVEEWHAGAERSYIIGALSFRSLMDSQWWRESNRSLILMPEPVIEDLAVRQLKKKSLSLAGLG
jgi:homoserine dehydrogenase